MRMVWNPGECRLEFLEAPPYMLSPGAREEDSSHKLSLVIWKCYSLDLEMSLKKS